MPLTIHFQDAAGLSAFFANSLTYPRSNKTLRSSPRYKLRSSEVAKPRRLGHVSKTYFITDWVKTGRREAIFLHCSNKCNLRRHLVRLAYKHSLGFANVHRPKLPLSLLPGAVIQASEHLESRGHATAPWAPELA
jgi:hypothetical protein